MKRWYAPILVLLCLSFLAGIVMGAPSGLSSTFSTPATYPPIERVSIASDGTESNALSFSPSISGNGRFVAFASNATNLVPFDANHVQDVFVHDRDSDETSRISVASNGTQGNGPSTGPIMSFDGRYVAFCSSASTLVPQDTNGFWDVFVHDLVTSQTTRISVASDDTQADGDSDCISSTISGDSYSNISISGDGRYVVFSSLAGSLVPHDTNDARDIFVHNRENSETARVSIASDGAQADGDSFATAISDDGRYVAFYSDASTLVPEDTNGLRDAFLHDRITGTTTRISIGRDGVQANSSSGHSIGPHFPVNISISGNGRYVAFSSFASNLVTGDVNSSRDIFVYDQLARQNTMVSVASGGAQSHSHSSGASISKDGRYFAFSNDSNLLVPGDYNRRRDIFVHDRVTRVTTRASVASDGTQADQNSYNASISGNGQFVAFTSHALNLVPEDSNNLSDVFARDAMSLFPPTLTPTDTSTPTTTPTATVALTSTPTPTSSPTVTASQTPTPTASATATVTLAPTSTRTTTPIRTSTNSPTLIATPTVTGTITPTSTMTHTPTHPLTPSDTSTPMSTATNTPTFTPSSTSTMLPPKWHSYMPFLSANSIGEWEHP